MRQFALPVAFILAAMTTSAFAQDVYNYTVDGTNLDGSKYGGTATITLTSDTTCEIAWTTGPTTSQGICMRNGIALAAGYTLQDRVGLVIYEIKDDGTLEGLWTIAGVNGNGTEVLTPVK